MPGKNYRDLKVWQEAMELAVACYEVSKPFPKNEMYGLASQIRRAAVSIAANIAEGQGRRYERDFARQLSVASGSLSELETHIELCLRLGYIDASSRSALIERTQDVGRMLHGLTRALRAKADSR